MREGGWFTMQPRAGTQRAGFSDIAFHRNHSRMFVDRGVRRRRE